MRAGRSAGPAHRRPRATATRHASWTSGAQRRKHDARAGSWTHGKERVNRWAERPRTSSPHWRHCARPVSCSVTCWRSWPDS